MSAKATTTATTQGFKRCAAIAALAGFPRAATGLPVSERLCERVLSLPVERRAKLTPVEG